jgi:SAM-dependent methyltransferase
VNYERLSSPVAMDFPEEWYDFSVADHFWFSWRVRVLSQLIMDRSLPVQEPLRVLEVGCGRGVLRTQIESVTRWKVDGVDVSADALQKADPGRGRTLLYNVQEHLPEFHEAYEAMVLFDVLEHIEEPESFLTAAAWHLKPGGWVILNVPALKALYSRYDKVVGHFRRYDPQAIRQLLKSQTPELEEIEIRYWGFSLLPVAWLRKILLERVRADKVVETGFRPPSRWINQLFRAAMFLETICLNRPPLGTSLMVLARKRR